MVPGTFHELTSRRVLTSEWVDGEKLSQSMASDVGDLVNVGVISYLKQLLDTGFFHVPPPCPASTAPLQANAAASSCSAGAAFALWKFYLSAVQLPSHGLLRAMWDEMTLPPTSMAWMAFEWCDQTDTSSDTPGPRARYR